MVLIGRQGIFASEFAMVEIDRDESANGVRLHIRDLSTGNEIYLDPMELEALTRLSHHFFVPLVSPMSRERTPVDDMNL